MLIGRVRTEFQASIIFRLVADKNIDRHIYSSRHAGKIDEGDGKLWRKFKGRKYRELDVSLRSSRIILLIIFQGIGKET